LSRFHHKAKKSVSIAFMRLSSKVGAGGGNGKHAKQVGVADGSITAVNHYPDMRCQVAMKGAVSLQPVGDGM
jgi:hypothetical protein